MTEKDVLDMMLQEKMIAILRGIPDEIIADTAAAVARAGVKFIEITYNQKKPDVYSAFETQIAAVKEILGDSVVYGAGTVLNESQAEFAYKCGCRFIVSPNADPCVIRKAKELGCISIPGAMTPSEIVMAHNAGADIIKLYIIEDPQYVKYLQGPLGHIIYQATCNVSPDTIPRFLDAGISLFGTRAFITSEMIEKKQYSAIEKSVAEYLEAIRRHRS